MYKVKRYTLEEARQFQQNIKNNKKLAWDQSLYTFFEDPRNIAMFAYIVLPDTFFREFKKVHYELFDFLQIGIKEKSHKGAKLPRGYGKSTIATKLGVIYEVCYAIHPYILINSYNDDMSISKVSLIRDELEHNPIIKYIYGDAKSDEWNKSNLIAFDKVKVQAISTGQNARGFLWRNTRPSKIVSDDILKDDQVQSPEARETTENWYTRALMECLTPKGVMEFVNTPLHPDDLIEKIFKKQGQFEKWDTFHRRALEKDGESIDPDWKTTEELLEKQRLNPHSFAQEYQGEPVSVIGGFIQKEDLRFYDYIDINQFNAVYIHADTTHTAKTTSDYFCLMAIGEHIDNKNYYVLDFTLDKLNPEQQARQLISFYQRYGDKVQRITYDEKANQGFGHWTKELARREYNLSLPLQELKYSSDKVNHFEPHIPHFKSNRVYFPARHPQLQIGLDQLLVFPCKGINDDFVDGLSGCLDNYIQSNQPRMFIIE